MRPWTIPILGVVALSLAIPSGADARLRFGSGLVLGAVAGAMFGGFRHSFRHHRRHAVHASARPRRVARWEQRPVASTPRPEVGAPPPPTDPPPQPSASPEQTAAIFWPDAALGRWCAPLDDFHPWRGRFVPCRSFRCRGPAEIRPGRGIGCGRGCDVRRLPTFVQTLPPTAHSTCIGSRASRCALGAAPGSQHTATRRERASTADEPASTTQCVSRADLSDILARCRR